MTEVITRFPPSPTGEIHIGNIRTILFNYLYAKQKGGKCILRFEDTDKERSSREHEKYVLDALHILGITYDEGPYRQSERTAIYSQKIQELVDADLAYEAESSSDDESKKVIRFRNPNTKISFNDAIRGEITIDTTDFGDFVIARNIDDPLYHLSVVVDDIEMGVTDVIRGEDHITSTPRQILLINALKAKCPRYAHLPLIIGDDKKKLSKRHGAVTVGGFLAQGYLPQAIVNYLSLLGWNPGDNREIFSIDELIAEFDLKRVQKNPAMFDYHKLDDINRQYLLKQDAEYVAQEIYNFLPKDTRALFESDSTKSELIMELVILERINKFGDVTKMADRGEFDYYFNAPAVDIELIRYKEDTAIELQAYIQEIINILEQVKLWSKDAIKDALWEYASGVGRGHILHPLRTILSGKKESPDPFTIATILGKEETLNRLRQALNTVS
ncbi:MAG: glutamate--tRNA ligase [Patescibacteria group bacterium]